MSITGLPFLVGALVSAVVYYLLPKGARWVLLLALSVLFYLSYGLRAVPFLLLTVLFTYVFARVLTRMNRYKPSAETREARQALKRRHTVKRRLVLALALAVNFACLVVLKYGAFLVSCVDRFLGFSFPLPTFLLPLGISFYIFQTSGYLIDVYRGKYEALRSFPRYALFVCYFPQMVQGPINRFPQLGPQLFEGNDFSWDNIQHGFLRILFGVLKKALIADTLAPIVTAIYSGYAAYPGAVAFVGSALYCLQLYCDFSGGIDLVMGVSRLFGVTMQENFCRPYLASSLSDFWRRWHISLGEWMKDYLFYPLAFGKPMRRLTQFARRHLPEDAAKRVVPSLATFVVFLAVGMWQGPGFQNLAYGLWNGFWMSLALFWALAGNALDEKLHYRRHKTALRVVGILRTNLLVIIGRCFSHADSLRHALGMLKHTFLHPNFSDLSASLFAQLGFTPAVFLKVLPAAAVLLVISLAQERGTDVAAWLCARKWYVQLPILFAALLLVTLLVYGNANYVPIAYIYESV